MIEPQKWASTLGSLSDTVTLPDEDLQFASFKKLFPALTQVPLSEGGVAPQRTDFNTLFKLLGDNIFYIQQGGVFSYSDTADYERGAFVKYNNELYLCIQANGASSTVKAPTKTAYWSKITTLADVANAFANQDLSNLSASGQAIINNKADKDFSNVTNTANILMAHNAMPSNVYDNLTLGATGTVYIAPADGWFILRKMATQANQSGDMINYKTQMRMGSIAPSSSSEIRLFMFAKKGDGVGVSYAADGEVSYFRFIYAVGSISEHV